MESGIALTRKIRHLWSKITTYTLIAPFCISFGKHSNIIRPMQIRSTRKMRIGAHTLINDFCFIVTKKDEKPEYLKIGDHVTLGHFNHIIAYNEVVVEDWVLTADRVLISDSYHSFEDVEKPIVLQQVKSKGETIIGEGSWIGENSCVISCSIGKHCVIGANSVVLNDIPDYCMAVGNPARVIKRYNSETNEWERV